jgi:hypothetical protein
VEIPAWPIHRRFFASGAVALSVAASGRCSLVESGSIGGPTSLGKGFQRLLTVGSPTRSFSGARVSASPSPLFAVLLTLTSDNVEVSNKRSLFVSFKLPYAAETSTIAACIGSWLGSSYMRLLASSLTVGTGTTLADCTGVEATFAGYSPYGLTGWTTPAIDGDGAAATLATGLFTGTGGGGTGNIYGYFLTDALGSYFFGVEVFSSGPINAPTGVQLAVNLTYTGLSRY